MRNLIVIGSLVTAVALGGCGDGSRKAPSSDGPASEAAARAEVAGQFGGYSETICVAKQAGYDYLDTVSRSLLRQPPAMHDLLVMTEKAGFDAASSEGHSEVLGHVLRDVGDRFFGACLAGEPNAVQNAVREDLLYDLGYGNVAITTEEIRRLYPKTFPDSCQF